MPRTKPPASSATPVPVPVLPARDSVVFPGMIHTLHVAREASKRAVRAAMAASKPVFVVSQRDREVEDPRPASLFRIGCLCEPLQAVPLPDGSLRVALRAIKRAEAQRFSPRGGYLSATVAEIAEPVLATDEGEAMMRASVEAYAHILSQGRQLPAESIDTVAHQETPGALADAISHHLPLRPGEKQSLLEILDPERRLEAVYRNLAREQRLLSIQADISNQVDREFAAVQRETFLREQLRTIQTELESMGEQGGENAQLRERIESAGMAPEALERARQEFSRLEKQPPLSPEGLVIRNYLEWMADLPWDRLSPDRLDVREATG
jgi:ATP-dependent Lon protease